MLSSCDVKTVEQEKILSSIRSQKTIAGSVSFSGVGLFSGHLVELRMREAPSGTGIVFQRNDLPGKPQIKAHVDNIYGTPRCTILGKNKVIVQSVEHILSALKAFEIDNAILELSGPEVPVGDGSALAFVEMIDKADIVELEDTVQKYFLPEPIYWCEKEAYIIALPSTELRFSYTLSYPNHPLLHAQFYSFVLDTERYVDEIAPCRTFSLYEEILPLLESGVIKGGSLENGLVIRGEEILNPGGIRFSDEMVRHKILDLVGDISLISGDGTEYEVVAHFVAIRSGHYANGELSKKIVASMREMGKI